MSLENCTGGTIYTIGGKRVHVFSADDTFSVPVGDYGYAEILIIAGGGGGGSSYNSDKGGGGGGAGGIVHYSSEYLSNGSYSVTVGGGGAGGAATGTQGTNGNNSVFGALTTAVGGGGGGAGYPNAGTGNPWKGLDGGSGGGGVRIANGGLGTAGQGNNGGNAGAYDGSCGGGGAGSVGANNSSAAGAAGGSGLSYSTIGYPVQYGGGGGGGAYTGAGGAATYGGGAGGNQAASGSVGTDGTGGGGGGAGGHSGNRAGSAGGSGIVIVSYYYADAIDYFEYSSDTIAQKAYVSSNIATSDTLSNLVAHYKMNDNAGNTTVTDATGSNNATCTTNTSSITAAGKINTSLAFTSSYYASKTSFSGFPTAALTVIGWCYLTSSTASQWIMMKGGASNGEAGFWINSSGYLSFSYKFSGGSWADHLSTATATRVLNEWHQYAFTWDGSYIYFYVDGAPLGNPVAASGTLSNVYSTVWIAKEGAWGSVSYVGRMDDLRIYARALSATDISVLYNSGAGTEDSINTPAPLQCYSETTIKSQGTYSLKGIAQTTSLNATLTKTTTQPIDLTSYDFIYFDTYMSRTGSNISISIHDAGGTTSTYTVNQTVANTWQTNIWNISEITATDRDSIDSIIITVYNADVINTFYIDNMYAVLGTQSVSVTDISTGTDTFSLLNMIPVSDVGALLQEILSAISSATITDTVEGTENLTLANNILGVSDTSTALDILSALGIYLQITDTAEGAENLSALRVYSLNDLGAGADTETITVVALLIETSAGFDIPAIINRVPIQTDSGAAIDALFFIKAVLRITDMGADTDSVKQITVVATSSDSGVNAGEGAFIINAMPLQIDSGTMLSESLTLFIRALLTEYSTASDDDIKNIIANLFLYDSATGLEVLLRTIYVDIIYGISKINITESLTSILPTDPVYGISNVDTSVSADSDFGSL
jgi:hypothetical protein